SPWECRAGCRRCSDLFRDPPPGHGSRWGRPNSNSSIGVELAQDRAPRPELLAGSDSSFPAAAPQPSSDPRMTGTYFLGRYRVVDEIGIGGMASVHLARMDGPGGFQKWVAIKRIHAHLVEDESFIDMFLDEARVAARISHPNVASVFELGKHEDTY